MKSNGETQLVGIMGWPVAHSLSPVMHNAAFEHLGLNWRYVPLPVREGEVGTAIRGMVALGFRGVNVTIPHKLVALAEMDRLGLLVEPIGAINTIVVNPKDRTLEGHNTDYLGFLNDLYANNVVMEKGMYAVILGAGGAARACLATLLQAGATVAIVNRTPESARELVVQMQPYTSRPLTAHSYADLPALAENAALIVNCTSVGMWPKVDESPWPGAVTFPKNAVLYDTVYRPNRTRLMQTSEAAGARAIGGIGMLVGQGAVAFEMWTGQRAPVDVMRAACEAALEIEVKV